MTKENLAEIVNDLIAINYQLSKELEAIITEIEQVTAHVKTAGRLSIIISELTELKARMHAYTAPTNAG